MFPIYIITNQRNGTLFTGHTDYIWHRMRQHQCGEYGGFAATYGCKHLVWYEAYETLGEAFLRAREVKKWPRSWKLKLIEEKNADWLDLATIPFWPLLEMPVLPEYQRELVAAHMTGRG